MRFIITLFLSMCIAQAVFAKAKKAPPAKSSKTKVTRVVSVNKNHTKKQQPKKQLAKKAPKKMSESERKALAKRQVEQARRIASQQQQQQQPQRLQKPEKPPRDFRANNEVIIKDHGFEQTPPTAEETAVMTAAVTTQDLQLDNTNGTTPYIDGTAVYVDRDTSSSVDDYESIKANDYEVDFED